MIKSSYKVDLRALHSLCDANYARLLRLFPDYEGRNIKRFSVDGIQVHIEVLERSRYTTLFCLRSYRSQGDQFQSNQSQNDQSQNHQFQNHVTTDAGSSAPAESSWLSPLSLEARAYHDAGMLEVVRFQNAGKTAGRYAYPNPSMHQQDEKNQQNTFLADWLSHCLHHGQADLAGLLKPGAEHA